MSRLTKKISNLALIAICGAIFTSCTQPVTSTTTNPPSDLTAMATSSSTIAVSWKRDPADVGSDTIVATSTKATVTTIVASPDTTGILSGLDTGITYTVSVHSSGGTSTQKLVATTPPTRLVALALDSATISVGWSRVQGDTYADTIIATPSNGGAPVKDTVTSLYNSDGTSISGLSEGVVYTISIHSTAGSSTPLQWMTAERTDTIKIYETKDTSSNDPSALILGTHNTHHASLSGITNADFVLESITDSTVHSGISLVSGHVNSPSWNATRVDSSASDHPDYVVSGLDKDWTNTNYQADQANSSANAYDIPNDNNYATNGSRVLIVTTADNHLALVEIVPDPSGTLYSTESGTTLKYLTLNVSYQSAPSQPYAARGHSHNNSGTVRRISAH